MGDDNSSRTRLSDDGSWQVPEPGQSELVQMRIRLIALENILVGLLSGASEEQIGAIEKRADTIEPKASRHPLTELASKDMRKLIELARRSGTIDLD